MNFKLVAGAILTFLSTSCGNYYIRYSNLHHTSTYRTAIKIVNKKSHILKFKAKGYPNWHNQIYNYTICRENAENQRNDSCLLFLENHQVLYFQGSYWVQKNAPDSLIKRYTNPEVNF